MHEVVEAWSAQKLGLSMPEHCASDDSGCVSTPAGKSFSSAALRYMQGCALLGQWQGALKDFT